MIAAVEQQVDALYTQVEAKMQLISEYRKQMRAASVMAKEQRDKVAAEIEKALNEIDDLKYRINREYANAERETISAALELIAGAIDAVAQRGGYALILRGESVVYFDPRCDVTQAVIDELNRMPAASIKADAAKQMITSE